MGTIVERDGKYRAMVRKVGHRSTSKTFDTVRQAKLWIAERELALASRTITDPAVRIDALVDRYAVEVAPRRQMADSHLAHDVPSVRRAFGATRLADLGGRGLIDWCLRQPAHHSPGTRGWAVARLFGLLRQAELHWQVSVPWDDLRASRKRLADEGLIAAAGERDRRVTDAEFNAILAAVSPRRTTPMPELFRFLLATAMRVGEACRITWTDVDAAGRTVVIRDRKHPTRKLGNHQTVPLLRGSWEILAARPRTRARCWPHNPTYVSKVFHQAAVAAGVEDVVLHDLRHEGISRMFEVGFSIPEVALVSGHKDWAMLRRYTRLMPAHLHAREAALRPQTTTPPSRWR